VAIKRGGGSVLDKRIRYVYGVNPITGVPCTTRVVVTAEDVTLWQVDQKIESEAAFDDVDTDNLGMVCLSHAAFDEVIDGYIDDTRDENPEEAGA